MFMHEAHCFEFSDKIKSHPLNRNKYSTQYKMKHSLWKERLKTDLIREVVNQLVSEKTVFLW